MELFGVATKRYYSIINKKMFKKDTIETHWFTRSPFFFYCNAFEEAKEKYLEMKLHEKGCNIFEILDQDIPIWDNWLKDKMFILDQYEIINTGTDFKLDFIKENSSAKDFRRWLINPWWYEDCEYWKRKN